MKKKIQALEEYRSFYKGEATTYDRRRYETPYGRLFKTLHKRTMRVILEPFDRKLRVLEIACGTGHMTELLADMGFNVIATDITQEMLNIATSRISSPAIKFMVVNAERLPFADRSFDIIVATRFMHLFSSKHQFLIMREMHRVLRPTGSLILDFDNKLSHMIFLFPTVVYNVLRYARFVPDSHYNTIRSAHAMYASLNISVEATWGVGSYLLCLPVLISLRLALHCGNFFHSGVGRCLAEQFIIIGRRI